MKINKTLNELASCVLELSLKKNNNEIVLCLKSDHEDGFFIDFISQEPISTNDFNKIEKAVTKITTGALEIKYLNITNKEANEIFVNNKYKLEIINSEFKNKDIPIIKIGEFYEICNELEYVKTNVVKFLKIMNVGGSYWKGDSNNIQLTRLYGAAFDSKEELDLYINEYNERAERDHRKIGKDLELFTFDLLAGQGLPIWLPNGTIIRKEIRNFLSELEFKYGFENTYTPILGNVDLYKKSGHWDHYKENMFPVMKVDNEELVLRPMTCPHHVIIYSKKPYSYKQLPIRLCEESMLHRYESSGGLTGFERVREMVLEDTHIFCTPEQVEEEVFNCYNLIKEAHEGLNSEIFQVDLSLHDPNDKEKFHSDSNMWENAENSLRVMLKKHNINFVEKIGEAAFYGPKIDFQVKTVLGRIITMSTIQLDFLLPEKFSLEYKDQNSEFKKPIMIHLGIIGTYERLLSIILEQTKGILPVWLSPEQIIVIPVNNEIHLEFAKKINDIFKNNMIRIKLDNRDERMSKKIREAQIKKVPYQIIIGDEEVKNNLLSVRKYGSEETNIYKIDDFLNIIIEKIKKRN